jgi:hypothetical protein
MRTHFMARFRPADDTAWADPDTDPRLHFSLVTDLRGVRGYDSTAGQRLSRELEIRFSPDPGDGPDPDPDCTDLVDRVQWGISPASYPSLAVADVRGGPRMLEASWWPATKTIDVDGEALSVQLPSGNLVGALMPRWSDYRMTLIYAPPLEGTERPLVCRAIGPDIPDMQVPVRLVVVVDGSGEVVADRSEDGDAFRLSGDAPDPAPAHSGLTWIGEMGFDSEHLVLDYFGTIDQQWTLAVLGGPSAVRVVRVSGDQVGVVGEFPLGAEIAPQNTDAGAPYFTLEADGWMPGADPDYGDGLYFSTSAARIVSPSATCDDEIVLDQEALERWIGERQGAALQSPRDYPVYLETAQGWGELTWRAVHNCPAAGAPDLPGRVRFTRDRPSDGAVWVYDRRRVRAGTLRLSSPAFVVYAHKTGQDQNTWHQLRLNGTLIGDTQLIAVNPGIPRAMVVFAPEGFEGFPANPPYAPPVEFRLEAVYRYAADLVAPENLLELTSMDYFTGYTLHVRRYSRGVWSLAYLDRVAGIGSHPSYAIPLTA